MDKKLSKKTWIFLDRDGLLFVYIMDFVKKKSRFIEKSGFYGIM
jgi:histidinol phosphatase-like enzyme